MRILILVLIALLFSTCKKDKINTFKIQGIVLHNISHQPLPGQEIIIYIVKKPTNYNIYETTYIQTTTDAGGKFGIEINGDNLFAYSIDINNGQFVSITQVGTQFNPIGGAYVPPGGVYVPTTGNSISPHISIDTLYAEKPAFVTYSIHNLTNAANDSLFVLTPYQKKYVIVPFFQGPISVYKTMTDSLPSNWAFYGTNINQIVVDTIPAESHSRVFIEWIHKQTNILSHVKDSISVAPFGMVNYQINY